MLYIDTAEASEIKRFMATGMFSGVTCNPFILKAAGLGPSTARQLYDCAVGCGAKQLFLQAVGATPEAQLEQALYYRSFGPEVVVKGVGTAAGLSIVAQLVRQGVPTLVTALHDAKQVVGAMAAGADYVAPYLSEMYASGRNGVEEVLTMMRILSATGSRTRLVMAGLQDIPTLVQLAVAGMDHLTMTPAIADTLFAQPETEAMGAFFERVVGG
jgi:transaldolase